MILNKKQHKLYDIFISLLACAAVILIIIDISDGLVLWQSLLSKGILAVFIFDYILRLWSAKNKKKFITHNICDLIAILPFHIAFRGFKIVHMNRLIRFLKLPQAFAFLYRPLKKATRFLNTNGFKYVLFVTTLLILLGGILIHFAEGMSIGDGIWWAFVTATTVGYGDISPDSLYGRLIAMVLMLMGIGLIGSVTSTLTSYFLKASDQNVESKAIQMIQERLEHFHELSDEDVENICQILRAMKTERKDHPSKKTDEGGMHL